MCREDFLPSRWSLDPHQRYIVGYRPQIHAETGRVRPPVFTGPFIEGLCALNNTDRTSPPTIGWPTCTALCDEPRDNPPAGAASQGLLSLPWPLRQATLTTSVPRNGSVPTAIWALRQAAASRTSNASYASWAYGKPLKICGACQGRLSQAISSLEHS